MGGQYAAYGSGFRLVDWTIGSAATVSARMVAFRRPEESGGPPRPSPVLPSSVRPQPRPGPRGADSEQLGERERTGRSDPRLAAKGMMAGWTVSNRDHLRAGIPTRADNQDGGGGPEPGGQSMLLR